MGTFLSLIFVAIIARFRTRASLEAELVALRHQVLVLRRCRSSRPPLDFVDRLIWIWLYRLSPGCLDTLVIVRPETVVCDGTGPVSAPDGD